MFNLVVIMNVRFILMWLYYMLKTQKYQVFKKISRLMGIMLLMKSDNTETHSKVSTNR